MKIEKLMDSLPDNYTSADRELVMRAYQFAEKAHAGQKRASGEPYITHCVEVAAILCELGVSPTMTAAGLLHDTVEDTTVTLKDLQQEFGDEIVKLVDGVTKLTNLPKVLRGDHFQEELDDPVHQERDMIQLTGTSLDSTKKSRTKELRNETLRKTFLAMGEDVRVVVVKLADRLHNMRTLGYIPEAKRKMIADETMEIFAPLANRLGIWQIKWELEDLSFRYMNPEKFKEIAQNIDEGHTNREKEVLAIIKKLGKVLDQAGIQAEISGRSKHLYSIYRKMISKDKPFDMVRDLRGIRLIVSDIPACYSTLGVIHTHWRPIPQEFDDYIAAPKDNFYQSLHTAIIYDDGKPLEVQIRTSEMDQNAEYGIAAHWRYKERGKVDETYEQRINWIRKMMEWKQEVLDPQEFVDSMKTDVFKDRVYVFTPHGDIIDLPAGSTPIDFAYHVHTSIGNRCRGSKVNGKLVNLDYVLKTGDQVEILTAKQGGPSRDWLNPNLKLVNTQRSRSKIRQWFKWQDHDLNLSQGKLQLERELRRLGMPDVDLQKLANSFDFHSVDDMYVALGSGDISIGRIVNVLFEVDKGKDPLLEPHRPTETMSTGNGVTVLGLKGILTTVARCCNPVPGDEIVGYITRGRGATIHRLDCPNVLRKSDKERIIKVSWGEPQTTYPVAVEIKAYDRQGLMGDISVILSDEGINLIDVRLKVVHNIATFHLVLEIQDISQLSRILTRIENLANVMEAHRVKPG
jgi:GTP diphosphokinase / guanosine-3',5'-bis(diphosphate) 3'-diphosphatase